MEINTAAIKPLIDGVRARWQEIAPDVASVQRDIRMEFEQDEITECTLDSMPHDSQEREVWRQLVSQYGYTHALQALTNVCNLSF